MLTVKEINEVSFGKAGFSGYKPEDVDNFIDEVAASFTELEQERDAARQQLQELSQQNAALAGKIEDLNARNGELQKKLSILAQKIESYRADEDGIKEAIISAQRMGKEAVQQARDKASLMLEDAKDEAEKILDEAKTEASKTAGEYAAQAESKKAELEEIKRQVSTFRVSLLEMYKKHLECIDHIPSFRLKETEESRREEESEVQREQRLLEERQAQQKRQMEEERELERQREIQRQRELERQREAERQRQLEQQREAERQRQLEQQREAERQRQLEQQREAERQRQLEQQREAQRQRQEAEEAPGLHDRVSYVQEQLQPSVPESDYMAGDLSDVGIDLQTYSSIPETLRREKSSHYSNLEFGDGVELDAKGRKRKK